MRLLLLLLPALALASMEVKMSGKVFFDSKHILGNIHTKGFEKRAITDSDRVAFQIQDEDLKSAVEKYYGKRPDQIFFTRDTPWGDLYNKLGSNPVEVKIEPDLPIHMIEITSKKVVLTRSIYENDHTATKKIRIIESETTYDKVTSVWTNPRKVQANTVVVDIKLNFEVQNNVASVDHTYSFGINRKTVAKKERSQSGSVDLAAGQKVLAQLEVKKGTLKFQIPYKVSLSGGVTVNYNEEYKNNHFHGLDINQVLGNRTLLVYQTLLYEFYYGQNLNIIDAKDGYSVLKSFTESGTSSGHKRRASAAEHAAVTGKQITKKAAMVPIDFNEEDLKSLVEEVLENQDDEESSESSEQSLHRNPDNKTPLEVPKSD